MTRVIGIRSGNINKLVYKIQNLDYEVNLKYSNILVKAFEGTENTRELIFLKDTVEASEEMVDNSQSLSIRSQYLI
jgi:hypothetical protein